MMEEAKNISIEKLKILRATIKGKITRIQNFVQAYDAETQNLQEIITRSREIETLFAKYEDIQGQIEELSPNTAEEEQQQYAERNTMETKYFSIKSEIDTILHGPPQPVYNSSVNDITMSQHPVTKPFCGVKLPPLEIPKFAGDVREWPAFKMYFQAQSTMGTRALHLELVTDLSSQAFICALKRFISRRGLCTAIYSDNATNFKGAKHELHSLYQMFKNEESYSEIVNFCSTNSIQFNFQIPLASHMGGIYEAGIKSVKNLLKRQLLDTKLTYEHLYTILVQIEGILNSRPLCSISDLPNDLTCLTPGHFIIGSPINDIPEPTYLNLNESRLNIYQRIVLIKQRFWKQFYCNYLSELQPRNKWYQVHSNLKINDLVIIKDETTPPTCWPLGRIVSVNRNKNDNLIRSVVVKTSKGEYSRPIHKLILIPRSS